MTRPATEAELRAQGRLGMVLRGKYRLDRVLGVGGMAAVYKATHRNQAEFAVKMLHPELSLREDVRTRFLREGYAANSVKHPGAVLVVDDDIAEDGSAFLVMEHLEGDSCDALWERRGNHVPVATASAILLQLLDVLAAAHAKGIVHRDIKPGNIFVTRDGVVKVLDFGIARARDALASEAQSTGTGMLLGTPAFMPPEQALAKSSEISGQTDLWAVGATFFSLVSGLTVHEADNAPQIMVKAATEPARRVASVAPGVPPAIAAVVDRALSFRREERWPSAASMRDALLAAHRASFGEPTPRTITSLFEPPASRGESTAHVARTPVPIGRSTARPVATDVRPGATRSRWLALGGAGAALGALTFAFWLMTTSRAPPVATLSSAASAQASSAVSPLPPVVPEPSEHAAGGAALRMDAGASQAPAPPATGVAAFSEVDASALAAQPRAKTKGVPATRTEPARDCDVPYYFDAHGNRVFKKECL